MIVRLLTIVFLGLSSTISALASDYIAANLLARVKKIVVGSVAGTAFAIELDGRQYLVTAKHVVAGQPDANASVRIYRGRNSFSDLQVDILRCDDPVDIAVLMPKQSIEPVTYAPLIATSDKIAAGEDIYFVGYPFADPALNSLVGEDAVGFIRKGILSAIRQVGQATVLYLDGMNNPGFSGAPVFFRDLLQQGQPFKVAAVVSGYRPSQSDIMKLVPISEAEITNEDRARNLIVKMPNGRFGKLLGTDYVTTNNTGIVVAYSIDHAVERIRRGAAAEPEAK